MVAAAPAAVVKVAASSVEVVEALSPEALTQRPDEALRQALAAVNDVHAKAVEAIALAQKAVAAAAAAEKQRAAAVAAGEQRG